MALRPGGQSRVPVELPAGDAHQSELQLEGVGPLLRVGRQHLADQLLHVAVHALLAGGDEQLHLGVAQQGLAQRNDVGALLHVAAQQLLLRGHVHEGDALHHGPDDDAQREDVRLGRVLALPHLGRHVEVGAARRRQEALVDAGRLLGVEARRRAHLAQAEVCHLERGLGGAGRRARLRDEDVVRLEVAVDDAVAVQEGQGAAQLQHEAGVGLAAGLAREQVGVHVAAVAEVGDEPQVVGAARVEGDLALQGRLHQLQRGRARTQGSNVRVTMKTFLE